MVNKIHTFTNTNEEFISLINRNAHNGKRSIIYFGNHKMLIPQEGIDIEVEGTLMKVYHNHILTAIINTDLIYGVSDERI